MTLPAMPSTADWLDYLTGFLDANSDLDSDTLCMCVEELLDKAHRRGAMSTDVFDELMGELFQI